jgi:quinol monooxygenase YgiN
MTTLMINDFEARAGKRDELVALLENAQADTRRYEGCSAIEIQVDQDDPDRLVVLARWESRSHHEAYRQWRNEGAMPEGLASLVASQATSYFDQRLDI